MKYYYGLLIIVLLFIGCRNNKQEKLAPAEPAFTELEETDTVVGIEFTESKILLPFNGNIFLTKKLKPDTLFTPLKGMEKYICDKEFLTYIPFPKVNELNVIVVPMKCDGYNYRYTMLVVDKDSIISNLLLECEKKDKRSQLYQTTSFEISKDYTIKTTAVEEKGSSHSFIYKTYKINDTGEFVTLSEPNVATTNCITKKSNVNYPIISDHLLSINYSNFTCNNVEGMKNYSCQDAINYVTLRYTDDGKYYVLIYTECGDSSYADLIVIHNNRVISGLTIDTATYDNDDGGENYSGEETTFEITEDLSVKLTHSKIEHGSVISEKHETYIIGQDGRFVREL